MTFAWEIRARVQFEGDAHVIEDACGFNGPNAWVIDGATTLLEPLGLPAASDPQWLAQQLNMILGGAEATGVRKVLAGALTQIDAMAAPLVGEEYVRFPSAAISVAQLNEFGVEVASLADCTVLVKTHDGVTHLVRAGDADAGVSVVSVVETPVVEPVETRSAPLVELVETGSAPLVELVETEVVSTGSTTAPTSSTTAPADPTTARRAALIRDRELRNTPGRLWVARREAEAAEHAHVVQLGRPELMVMASDGAWRAVELGLVSGPEEFLARSSSTLDALGLLNELRTHQRAIAEVADDATILTLAPRDL